MGISLRRSAGPRRPPRRIATKLAAAGRVQIEDGPFTDRVRASRLQVRPGRRPVLTGRLLNRTDVSEVLALQLQADFYDRRSRYLGSGKTIYEEAEEFFAEPLRFQVRAGATTARPPRRS